MTATQEWIPFEYRDFFDVPRVMVAVWNGSHYLFSSPFEEDRDEYSDAYTVYMLPADDAKRLIAMADWTELPTKGRRVGTIDVCKVGFDATKRQSISSEVFQLI